MGKLGPHLRPQCRTLSLSLVKGLFSMHISIRIVNVVTTAVADDFEDAVSSGCLRHSYCFDVDVFK